MYLQNNYDLNRANPANDPKTKA